MKCPNCNAETKDAKYCEYCGSELPKETPNINITNNYYAEVNNSCEDNEAGKCPKCQSSNVKFRREKVGEVGKSSSYKNGLTKTRKGNSARQSYYRTVGVCQQCGYTWDPNSGADNKKGKGCLWWFLMLCIWPIALSVWFYKTDKIKLDKKIRLGIIAVFWIIALVFGGSSEDTETTTPDTTIESNVESETTEPVVESTEEVVETTEEVAELTKLDVIDTFIDKYNSIAENPMTDAKEFDLQDPDYYRTEYRLTAYNDAKGKQCIIGEYTFDIVCTEEMFTGFDIRLYGNTDDRELAIQVFKDVAKVVYPDVTLTEIEEAESELKEEDYKDARGLLRDINYYYIDSRSELFMDHVMYAE